MVVYERRRHEMYLKLESALGREAADTLMAHLPPVGWADVATRRDLEQLEERVNLRFEAVHHRFDAMESRFDAVDQRFNAADERTTALRQELLGAIDRSSRKLTVTLTTLFLTVAGLTVAASRIF